MNDARMEVVMGIIMHGGNAKGQAFQAIQSAKSGQFHEADAALESAQKELVEIHNIQTDMLTREANGDHTSVDLYMVHAQDHLMNAITFNDLAMEFVELYKSLGK
ncbi:MAG: PTS lactose/cellobiose transporter subunit IIA [Streptococcaceae bacterium]|jgi:PTS system cellobiose-specific IIA component|nr:PTS lactose/cellobiose transporter subunit IIA [Streptococcaceae bacterium]